MILKLNPNDKIPLTEFLRFVNKAIESGSDYVGLNIEEEYRNVEYTLETSEHNRL